jgi:hypothetical protein
MTQPDGIDMQHSGWTNPEGFAPTPRPRTPAPPAPPVCGAKHPDGWECEMPPFHPGRGHKADDGMPGGLRWETEMADVSTLDGRRVETPTGRIVTDGVRDRIKLLAEAGLESPSPAAWAIALGEILDVCNG